MMVERATEIGRLEAIAADSWYEQPLYEATITYGGHVFRRHFTGARCLELGPAEGIMTAMLREEFESLTVVDGSERMCQTVAERYPDVTVVNSLFETFEPESPFDTIVLGHILEHVDEPRDLISRATDWLTGPEARMMAVVPNARSLHRQAAVLMGLLADEHELNETDAHHGHRRVYDPEALRHDFIASGLEIAAFGGYWMKPVSNAQIEASWTPEMLKAFMALGERYPDVAGEIYVVAKLPGGEEPGASSLKSS